MSVTRAEVVAYLEGLDAHALGELIDELQRRLGLPGLPAEVQTMGAMPTMGMPEVEAFTVMLVGFTEARKIELLRVVRELRPIGVLEAKRLVESGSVEFAECSTRGEAEALAARLRGAGGRVEIR